MRKLVYFYFLRTICCSFSKSNVLKSLFLWLWEHTHVPKVVSSNPSTIYWMNIFHISICCKICTVCLKRRKLKSLIFLQALKNRKFCYKEQDYVDGTFNMMDILFESTMAPVNNSKLFYVTEVRSIYLGRCYMVCFKMPSAANENIQIVVQKNIDILGNIWRLKRRL